MDDEKETSTNFGAEFLKGFVLTLIAPILVGGLILWWFGGSAGFNLRDGFELFLIIGAFMGIYVGGEMALGLLFAWDTPFQVKFTQFVGACFALVAMYFFGPTLLERFSPDEPEIECETLFEKKLGPITFSQEECEQP